MKTEAAPASNSLDALLRSCIHCGLCLSSCPTYLLSGDELESPRGRLMVMASQLEGAPGTALDSSTLDRCLGCRNCESACPSGVEYGSLLAEARSRQDSARTWTAKTLRFVVDYVLAHPRRLALAAALGNWTRPVSGLLPRRLRPLLDALPSTPARWPTASLKDRSGDVALLAGCAQRVFTPDVLSASARLLRAAGATPWLPPGQSCCGAMSHHLGSVEVAKEMARQNVDAFEACHVVVVPSAGCSAHMKDYGELLADEPAYRRRAEKLAQRTVDLVEWLAEHARALRFTPCQERVVYHPPCHHTHAQHIVQAPLSLLQQVPGLTLLPLRDAERCCGSAGSFSLLQPDLARQVRGLKLDALEEAGPHRVLTANPGCELFLAKGMEQRESQPVVEHLALFLARQLEDKV